MEKKEIRREMKRRNLALPANERARLSERIMEQVERLDAFVAARTVALFASLPDEPDTASLLARWHGRKRLVVPRVEGDEMEFYDYDTGRMERGAFGIAEPQAERPVDAAGIDFMLVPGTAFTADGARLGRGRGYYDRYLARDGFRACRVGVCYPHQIVAELPVEPHDRRVERLCTGD